MNARLWLVFGLWAAFAAYAQTAYPPSTPFLRIETGMHTAQINRIDVDAAERFLVTASDDKTARVWDLKDGKPLQVLRPPQGVGHDGELYAVAVSANGATVAVAGYTGPDTGPFSVYLFDRTSGTLTHSIPGFPDPIMHLAYSVDGQYLAVSLGGTNGIRVYRSSDLAEAARDAAYGGRCHWAEFDRTGRIVTASFDGFTRLYDKNFKLIVKKEAPGGKLPYSTRFSPDGSKVSVGFDDTTAVNVLSGRDLSFLSAPETPNSGRDLSSTAWSKDGRTLYAGGAKVRGSQVDEILSWTETSAEPTYWPASANTIMDIRSLSGTRIAVAAQDPKVAIVDGTGHTIWQKAPEILDYRSPAGAVSLSPNGSTIEFGFYSSAGSYLRRLGRFELARRQISLNIDADPSLIAPRTTGLDIQGWYKTIHLTLNGRSLGLEQYEMSRSLAISAKKDSFLVGSDWNLRLFEASGDLRWRTATSTVPWALNLTADGQFAVAAFGDGAIRWYRANNGQEVMGLFVDPDGKRWVLWTPEGFYDSSENADSLIGYHLNHGPDHEGEFVQVQQLKKLFYRPDLLAQRLKPESDTLIREALSKIGDVSTILHSGSPPDLTLLSPPESDSDGNFTLQFKIVDRGGGVGRIVYRIDGIEMKGRTIAPSGSQDTVALQFDLPPGRHTASATAYNRAGQVESRSISSVVNVKQPEQRPALYVLAVGISKYQDSALNPGVKFASSDAETIAARLKQQGAGLFRDVVAQVLTDVNASRDNIEKTVAAIAARIQPADEFVLYLAGHGMGNDGKYVFVTWNAIYRNIDALRDQSLNEDRLEALLKSIRANKTLLLLDTCSAGTATLATRGLGEKGSIERLSKLTGRAILAATRGDEMAIEGYQNHGAFTFAVLEGLSTAADSEGLVSVSALADRVEVRVPEITSQQQFPMRLIQGQTFPIARKQ